MTSSEAASAAPNAGTASDDVPGRPAVRPAATTGSGWPDGADDLAERLLGSLAISDREWHAVKGQAPRRAAEQVAAALVQLLRCDDPRQGHGGAGREQAIALLENGLAWLKGSLRDPGCPHRSR
ncbi:MAG: DUF6439 family protein [Synechococcaceae cyanobacterium]